VGIEDFDPLILLIINVLPALWLHFYYAGQRKTVPALPHDDSLQSFYKEYNITPKEKEIIELIIEGNSIKDIENKLFIFINTVKNHIYSIYRKAKVNSWLQLLKRIRQCVSEFS
jgi:DNA-binding NarL/FixJ family response regulator